MGVGFGYIANETATHLPLGREVTEPGWDTKEEGIELGQLFNGNDGVRRLSRGVHFFQDILRQSFWDPNSTVKIIESIKKSMVFTGRLLPDHRHSLHQT